MRAAFARRMLHVLWQILRFQLVGRPCAEPSSLSIFCEAPSLPHTQRKQHRIQRLALQITTNVPESCSLMFDIYTSYNSCWRHKPACRVKPPLPREGRFASLLSGGYTRKSNICQQTLSLTTWPVVTSMLNHAETTAADGIKPSGNIACA